MESTKPIKRNASIVEFSKDHHFALLLIWKIRQGLGKSIDPLRISRYVIHFFDADLVDHFRDEEQILFNRLSSENPLRIQAEMNHLKIRKLIEELKEDSMDVKLLKNIADSLEKHIRFEERQLFNHLQEALPAEVLSELAASIGPRPHDADNGWDDLFWEKKSVRE